MDMQEPRPDSRPHWRGQAVDFQAILETAPAYFYVADPANSKTLYRSPQAEAMLGYSLDEWESNPRLWNEILHPDDRARVEAEFTSSGQRGEQFHAEYRLIAKSGATRWVRDHAALAFDSHRRRVVQGVVLDITEEVEARFAAENELATTLSLLETAQRVGKVGTFVAWLDPARAGQDLWSKSCLAIFGLDEATHGGRTESFWKCVHPDDVEMVREAQLKARESGNFYDLVHRIIRPDGEMRWIRERARVERSPDGMPLRFLGVTLDVTEERALEEALERAESLRRSTTQFYDSVFERAPLGVCKADPHLVVIDANARLHEMLGAEPGQITGRPVAEFLDPEGMAQVMEEFRPLWEGKVDRIEAAANAIRIDGEKIWLRWSATTVRAPSGRVEYFLAMFEDITSARRAEVNSLNSLATLERLNQLKSEFVSVVSHEFRTALTGIQGFSEILRDEDLSKADVKEFATDINNDALRLNRMITEMLDLDRIEAGRMTLTLAAQDVNSIVREAVDRVAPGAQNHRLVAELDPSLPPIVCDGDRVTQVLSNLLSNAVKYSPAGGEIRVSTRQDGSVATISVQDHGLGLAPEFIGKVFDRYERFADKTTDKIIGTGLGLPIAQQIVEMHGGRMGVESVHGQGSTFWFNLPLGARIEAGTQ
jgi:PAS domain S-box-containing protein